MLLMNNLFVLLKEKQQHNVWFPTVYDILFFNEDILFSIYFIFMTF